MNKQMMGWVSLLVLVIAWIAIDSVEALGIHSAITGVIALGMLTIAGFVIRGLRKSPKADSE
ncbi:MAG: hypothetical protein KC423_12290 [Anaerolineales bacterium]|nr:hypothetical protein [Anaerolineales bacterium]